MVTGIVLAVAAIRYRRLRKLSITRTLHLIGILATATVPLWNDGVCPLTSWENGTDAPPESFLGRMCLALLYWDAPQLMLSVLSAAVALLTLVLYFIFPPWGPSPVPRPDRKENR